MTTAGTTLHASSANLLFDYSNPLVDAMSAEACAGVERHSLRRLRSRQERVHHAIDHVVNRAGHAAGERHPSAWGAKDRSRPRLLRRVARSASGAIPR